MKLRLIRNKGKYPTILAKVWGGYVTKQLAVIAGALLLGGCTAHVVEVRVDDTAGTTKVVQSSDFAIGTNDPVTVTDQDDCPTDLIQRVKFKQSFGQKLLSLVTLGLYDTATVEVTCKNAPTDIGSTDD